MSVHKDTLRGLQEALDFVKGDKTKGRSVIIEVSDEVMQFYSAFGKLSEQDKTKAMKYVNDLLYNAPVQA